MTKRLLAQLVAVACIAAPLSLSSSTPTENKQSADLAQSDDCGTCTYTGGTAVPASFTQEAVRDDDVPAKVVYIQLADDGEEPLFYDGDRNLLTRSDFSSMAQALPKDGKSAIELRIVEPQELYASIEEPSAAPDFRVGCYYIRISWEKHWIGSCIKRDVWHLGFMIKNTCYYPERMVVNGHASVWWQNGPQFGFYNSAGNGWCGTTVGTWTGIRNKMFAALSAANIGYIASAVVATAGTWVVYFAFGL